MKFYQLFTLLVTERFLWPSNCFAKLRERFFLQSWTALFFVGHGFDHFWMSVDFLGILFSPTPFPNSENNREKKQKKNKGKPEVRVFDGKGDRFQTDGSVCLEVVLMFRVKLRRISWLLKKNVFLTHSREIGFRIPWRRETQESTIQLNWLFWGFNELLSIDICYFTVFLV